MKAVKYFLHYLLGKHKWRFIAKTYSGNDLVGHVEDSYIFECDICHKLRIIKVVGNE